MTEHHFETHEPIELFVENGKGTVTVHAVETTESRVQLTGADAEDTQVDLTGGRLSVIAPQRRGGLFSGNERLDMDITIPARSGLITKLGSADLVADGELGTTRVRAGSGDVTLPLLGDDALVETGSGDVGVARAGGSLRVKSGSGNVEVESAVGDLSVSTGSGDVRIASTGAGVQVKTGSGDLRIDEANGTTSADVSLSTGSGDLTVSSVRRGRITSKGASGDVKIGVPAGTPVWTDVSTISGRIRSSLASAGQPEPGADHVELRVTTASGDIDLTQI